MPINKLTTLLDLSRQSKILSGETATFDGKIQAGIPFSGYPTGVDTSTIVSLGVISSETAVLSGNTGTTVFDVSNPSSPNYDILFSGFTANTWTNPLFSAYTSGLTLPILPSSADSQTIGPFWYLTQTGTTGDYVIGISYTGFSITYSFGPLAQIGTGLTYSGFTTAFQENFSAGTLDYKGPLDYISSKEDASIEGRLTTNKITITNGASVSTLGYVLTQTGTNGEGEWVAPTASSSGSSFSSITITNISTGISASILGITSGGTIIDGSDLYGEICDFCSDTIIGDVTIGSGVTETSSVNSDSGTINSNSPYTCTLWCYYKGGTFVGSTSDYNQALQFEEVGYTIRCCDSNSEDGGTNYGTPISGETTTSGSTPPTVITGLTRPFTVDRTKKVYLLNTHKSDVLSSNQVSISNSTLGRIELSTLSFIESSFNSKIYNSNLSGIISSENTFLNDTSNSTIINSQYSTLSGVTGSTIIGGNNITGTTDDTVYVPKLNIYNTLSNNNSLSQLLVRDPIDGSINYRDSNTFIPSSGNIFIDLSNLYTFKISGSANNADQIVLETKMITGNPAKLQVGKSAAQLYSESGITSINSYVNVGDGNVVIGRENGGAVQQFRIGDVEGIVIQDDINLKGLEYDSNYSSNYTNRSLVDKEYVDNSISATFLQSTTATTTTINFTGQTIYYNAVTPGTGNISENLTGSKLGLIQKIYHNDTSEPTYPAGWVLMGDAIYFTSTLNIIYAEWAGGSRVEYWYVQEQ